MKKNILAFLAISLFTSAAGHAGYTVPVATIAAPSIEVPYSADYADFTITATLDGELELTRYQLDVTLVPNDGVSGIYLAGADEAATDYILDNSHGWVTSTLDGFQLTGSDNAMTPLTLADITRNMITIELGMNLTAANIGDTYSVTFGVPSVADGTHPVIENYVPGTITVVPEPGGITLVAMLALAVGIRPRRGLMRTS